MAEASLLCLRSFQNHRDCIIVYSVTCEAVCKFILCSLLDHVLHCILVVGLDGPAIESRYRRDFPHPSRPALVPTQHPAWDKAAGSWRRPPAPRLAPGLKKEWSYNLWSPSGPSWLCSTVNILLFTLRCRGMFNVTSTALNCQKGEHRGFK